MTSADGASATMRAANHHANPLDRGMDAAARATEDAAHEAAGGEMP